MPAISAGQMLGTALTVVAVYQGVRRLAMLLRHGVARVRTTPRSK